MFTFCAGRWLQWIMVLAALSGCMETETRLIKGKNWMLWGSELDEFRQLRLSQPDGVPERCRYWTRVTDDLGKPVPLTCCGAFSMGSQRATDSLLNDVADERDRSCDALSQMPPPTILGPPGAEPPRATQ